MKKRNLFLVFVLLVLCGLGAREVNTQTPKADTPSKSTIVIVHGAWGGAWAFKNVEALLRQKGFEVYRPQLTGQGDRLTVEKGKEAKDDDFFSQSQRAKERGWTMLQLTSDHNPQWSAPEALVEMLAGIH